MNYYFPHALREGDIKSDIRWPLNTTTHSGEAALRLLLRAAGLQKGAHVALPAFVCEAVPRAILKEGLKPVILDLEPGETFWTEYSMKQIQAADVRAVILVHLYGALHPKTHEIVRDCRESGVHVIHDAAQSFGIDEAAFQGLPVFYSFGPGKATTAAGGGWIPDPHARGIESVNRSRLVETFTDFSAQAFFLQRTYGANTPPSPFTRYAKRVESICRGDKIIPMTAFQKHAANAVLERFPTILVERRIRHAKIASVLKEQSRLQVLNESDPNSVFKIVIFVHGDIDEFLAHLRSQRVPYYRPYDDIHIKNTDECPRFRAVAPHIVEISTEASLPMSEIDRTADVLASFGKMSTLRPID